jgi:hypothetical protein
MLIDAGAPAVLAGAPDVVMLAHAGALTVAAVAHDAVMLANAGSPAVLVRNWSTLGSKNWVLLVAAWKADTPGKPPPPCVTSLCLPAPCHDGLVSMKSRE